MGIFHFFKPKQEEVEAKQEAKKAQYLIQNKEWDKVAAIGEPAVKPLMAYIKRHQEQMDLVPALQILSKIGNLAEWLREVDIHLNLMLPGSLCDTAIYGNNYDERKLAETKLYERYYALVPVVSAALLRMGKSNVELFVNVPYVKKMNSREEFDCFLFTDMPVVWALCEIGDSKAAEAVVNWIFKVGKLAPYADPRGLLWTYKLKILAPTDHIREIIPKAVLTKLLCDYTDLILNVFAWKIVNITLETGEVEVDSSRCNDAIRKLCEIDTPISSNILHKMSRIYRLMTGSDMLFSGDTVQYLDFKQYRQIAEDELKRRGNPPYDSSAYLNKDAWNIGLVNNHLL